MPHCSFKLLTSNRESQQTNVHTNKTIWRVWKASDCQFHAGVNFFLSLLNVTFRGRTGGKTLPWWIDNVASFQKYISVWSSREAQRQEQIYKNKTKQKNMTWSNKATESMPPRVHLWSPTLSPASMLLNIILAHQSFKHQTDFTWTD